MKRPDVTFTVTVNTVAYVHGCHERRESEEAGYFGFHPADTCPNCRIRAAGWEFWGENGHRQGGVDTRAQLAHWLRTKARQQWRMCDGRIMGYRFVKGGEVRYVGNYIENGA